LHVPGLPRVDVRAPFGEFGTPASETFDLPMERSGERRSPENRN
jgi:hypothetical protein